MAFENFPYTDFHNLNLDWILSEMKKLVKDNDEITAHISDIESELTKLSEELADFYKPDVFFSTVSEVVEKYVSSGVFEEFIQNAVEKYYISGTPSHKLTNVQKQAMYVTAMSYFANAWKTRNSNIDYGNNVGRTDYRCTALDTGDNAKVYNLIDCSTFVLLCLMGIRYQKSRYINPYAEQSSLLGYSRDFMTTSYPESSGKVRWAYEIYLQALVNRWLYKPEKITDIETGDIVFFKWTDDWVKKNPDSFGAKAFNHIAHVGIAVSGCSNFTSSIGIVHATNTDAIMAYQPLSNYVNSLTSQEMVPYVMRPVLTATNFFVSGTYRYRSHLDINTGASTYTYSGGKVPSNMSDNEVNKSTGAVTASTKRWTSYFIPAEIDFFVSSAPSGIGYNVCFYKSETEYIGYSQNKTDVDMLGKANLLRIEFYKSDGSDITTSDKAKIIAQALFVYHLNADVTVQNECSKTASIYMNNDTIKYSSGNIETKSAVII